MKWHPIESVPKSYEEVFELYLARDGEMVSPSTQILIGRAHKKVDSASLSLGVVVQCSLRDGQWVYPVDPCLCDLFKDGYGKVSDPTHWALVPPPPNKESDD